MMVSRKDIQATCDDIVREFKPLQVILYGSYAYGTPKEYSDVDLLVIMPVANSEARDQAAKIRQRIPHRFSMDLLVRSPEDIAYRISHNDWFLREVTEKGEVLYESENFYLKPQKKENTQINPLTLEWVERAEGDFLAATQLYRGPNPVNHVICFLAQQCVEKYLKAWLQEMNIPIIRTHNLTQILDLILLTIPEWKAWKSGLSNLSEFAVETRYLADSPSQNDVVRSMETCEKVRKTTRAELKLPTEENEKNNS